MIYSKELIGQLFVFGFDGTSLPKIACDLLKESNASGVILFKRNIEALLQLVELNNQIITACDNLPNIISVDQEGGKVARLANICTPIPTMRVIGNSCADNIELAYKVGALMGRELAVLGFNLNYAPVLDVDANPDNPIIGDRSFSRHQEIVSEVSASIIKGMQHSGVAACGKHFPGHGDTNIDSHLQLPTIAHSKKQLYNIDLPPFKSAIAANVATIMTGHLLFPNIDSDNPATLSYNILTKLLRQKLGFTGLIISDDLDMKAVSDNYTLSYILEQGINAGIDIFLLCNDIFKVKEAINITHELVERNKISKERIIQSIKRIKSFKQSYIGAKALVSKEAALEIIRCKPHLDLMNIFK